MGVGRGPGHKCPAYAGWTALWETEWDQTEIQFRRLNRQSFRGVGLFLPS